MQILITAGVVAISLIVLAGLLHLLPKLGAPGRASSDRCARAPLLDVLITAFQIAPLAGGAIAAGWAGVAGALIGMLLAYFAWVWSHELANLKAMRGPRIVKTMNRMAGPGFIGKLRNHAAVWVTAIVLPLFWLVRAAQIFIYPLLVWLLRFPRYDARDWIAVSRQKFEGLVGHDLIWCLYCDWMTGVYSLGAEMLRNVESYWCPIRFYSGKKCANCAIDFPDVLDGWIDPGGSMQQVTEKLETMYGSGRREWFGHPARLTVEGQPTSPEPAELRV